MFLDPWGLNCSALKIISNYFVRKFYLVSFVVCSMARVIAWKFDWEKDAQKFSPNKKKSSFIRKKVTLMFCNILYIYKKTKEDFTCRCYFGIIQGMWVLKIGIFHINVLSWLFSHITSSLEWVWKWNRDPKTENMKWQTKLID